MKTKMITKGLGMLALLTLSASVMAMSSYPACQPIVQACQAAGFVKGGPMGHRLYKDCVKPIVMHQAPVAGGLALPSVHPAQVTACNAQRSGIHTQSQPSAPSAQQ